MGLIWLAVMCLAWGTWGFLDKKAADTIGIPATYTISFLVGLPIEAFYVAQLRESWVASRPWLPWVAAVATALLAGALYAWGLKRGMLPAWSAASAAAATLAGMLGGLAYLYATRTISGATAMAVQGLYPAVALILFMVFDGERPTARQIVGLLIAAIAVVLLIDPSSSSVADKKD
jgi:drug/metabolite transporter (DMT)-like permease